MCVFVALDTQHANAQAPYCHLSSAPLHNINPNILIKVTIFEKSYWIQNVCFDFLYNLCPKHGLSFPPLLHTSYITDCRSAPLNYRRLLSVLCPVRMPITTLDCVLLQDGSLVLAVGIEPGINFRICPWELIRTCLKAILLI